jgi:uncharacterized LabA/DUF88 family protein
MGNTVIFLDGEYARKIFERQGCRIDVPLFVKKVLELAQIDYNQLLRVYYYTSPPYQGQQPTPDEKQRYQRFQKFNDYLRRQDNFEIKLGRLEKRGGEFKQKMVDVHLSIDLVELSAKSKIETAILIAGDSDFVPAVRRAKYNGVRVILCCSFDRSQYHQNLWDEADRRIPINVDCMRECAPVQPKPSSR